jgi:hypothetical protein
MKPSEQPLTTQINLPFCKNEPMRLPSDKQRELSLALADLLWNAATGEPTQTDEGDRP